MNILDEKLGFIYKHRFSEKLIENNNLNFVFTSTGSSVYDKIVYWYSYDEILKINVSYSLSSVSTFTVDIDFHIDMKYASFDFEIPERFTLMFSMDSSVHDHLLSLDMIDQKIKTVISIFDKNKYTIINDNIDSIDSRDLPPSLSDIFIF